MLYKATVSGDITTAKHTISGQLHTTEISLTGALSINERYPAYEGDYTITPTQEAQVIEIEHKTARSNIIINPIPQNYGLITWNGSVLTVS